MHYVEVSLSFHTETDYFNKKWHLQYTVLWNAYQLHMSIVLIFFNNSNQQKN